ncbi:ribonuclease M5 [Haploplasma axanthum]|uniref:Ribonuclease M5 n=1 Tax=Haploplasma axanthum TaxID=29552 RepID=A0A449BBF5_HAPAX|nr:ribonuclease M5 [Haploplasma axanthum]VEU79721.1 Primase-like protein [Haploplasma axanthum]
MKKQIYVVEGKNDVTRLKQVFPFINVVSVGGSAIDDKIIDMLIEKKDTYDIILCMDPDYPGEKIRKTISSKLGIVSHVFLEREISYSKNKKKIGLEHLSDDDIKEVFKNIIQETKNNDSDITMSFLYEVGLLGKKNSKLLRDDISKKLNIGHVNGKTLYNRLINFSISKEDIVKHLS